MGLDPQIRSEIRKTRNALAMYFIAGCLILAIGTPITSLVVLHAYMSYQTKQFSDAMDKQFSSSRSRR